ncbi:hypothetical protein NDU88_002536 [Pleurodeles waltl]|uniref:Murine leukemia virus integrase C-terminal domain-containing protein n=1 Tax=Pleurodeles waltl TaxID=8319 RepID=A0AAV7Q6Y5_PLEWA|nr:hypothetical protein NDU88_002536 [Pleurodeles waltl]
MQTLKIATGATAPVAPFPLRRLHSEPASSWEGVSRWACGRPSGGRPPAQRETQNNRGGLLTAQRYSGRSRRHRGYRGRRETSPESRCLEPRWKGPFQVILTTTTAVKCAGVLNWIHASHTKRVTCPTEEEIEALKLPTTDRKVPVTETGQREPGGEQAEIEEGEIFSEEEAVDPFEDNRGEASGSDEDPEGDKEPATGEEAGEPDQRRAFPEADDTGKEKENLIDLLGGEDKTGQSEIVQHLPEPVAGPSGENSAKRRQSISPVKSKTKEILKEGEGPKLKEKRKEVSVVIKSPSEGKDTAKEQDISEIESKGDAKLKRKRILSRRYSGPEWA